MLEPVVKPQGFQCAKASKYTGRMRLYKGCVLILGQRGSVCHPKSYEIAGCRMRYRVTRGGAKRILDALGDATAGIASLFSTINREEVGIGYWQI